MRHRKSRRFARGLIGLTVLICAQAARGQGWPVGDGNTPRPIYSSFGQFYESAGGMHLHEGVDIPAPYGTPVYARANGKILGVNDAPDPGGFVILETPAGSAAGFNYAHIRPGNRPPGNNGPLDPGGPWEAGDNVRAGDVLGTVQNNIGHPAHLHVDRGLGTDPYFSGDGYPRNTILRCAADALQFYTPMYSLNNPPPVVSSDIKFRIAAHDRDGPMSPYPGTGYPLETRRDDNLYFNSIEDGTLVVGRLGTTLAANGYTGGGSANIDIVAMAYDQATAGGVRNAPRVMSLRVQGQNHGADTGVQVIYAFTGQYLQGPGIHGYAQARDPEARWLRTIYSNDMTADSVDITAPNQELAGTYWFQMTNYDGDQVVEVSLGLAGNDRSRYWNSDGLLGNDFWTQPGVDPVLSDATSNATAEFKDDFYDITVTATDHEGLTTSVTRTVLLDNWEHAIFTSKDRYLRTDQIVLSRGYELPGPGPVTLCLLDAEPVDGQELPPAWRTARADTDGELVPMDLGVVEALGTYYLVTDANGDGLYHSRLDAFTTFEVIPEPATLALLALGGAALLRRRRRHSA